MGVLAALGGALVWAISSTLVASQTQRLDTLSASALRASAAVGFFVIMLFALGASGDVGRMSALDIVQFSGTGLLTILVGETLFVASIAMIGMTRAFTTVVGVYNLLTFLLAALFLGEAVSWDVAAGSVLVILGVYLVALYGRPPRSPRGSNAPARSGSADATTPAGPAVRSNIDVRLPLLGQITPSLGVGVTLALVTGLVWAAGAVWLRNIAGDFDAAAVGVVRLPAAAALMMFAATAPRRSSFRRRSAPRRALLVLFVSGVLTPGIGSLFFIFGLQEIGAGQTVVLFSTSSMIALPLGAVFLREQITVWVAAGTLLAVGGIALIA